MKHTSGPWKLEHLPEAESLDGYTSFFQIRRALNTIAFVPQTTNADEQEANARLIAAAPELLAKSQNLLDWLRAFFPDEPLFSPDAQISNQAVYELETAIRKAKGE